MNYSAFKQAVIEAARAQGLAEYDLYYVAGSSTSVTAYEGDIDQFSDTATLGASFRCVVDGRMGYSNTQKLSQEEAERLVRDARAGALVTDGEGFAGFYPGGGQYAQVPQAGEAACDVEQLKQLALAMANLAREADPRAEDTPFSAVQYASREVALMNSHGLDLSNRQEGYGAIYEAVVADGGRKYSGMATQEALTAEGLDLKALTAEAVGLAVGSIGGTSVPSGTWPVIFSNRMMATLLGCFADVFSGDAAQKGLSLLAGREGEVIAAPLFCLVDDPYFAASADKTPFDDEGVPTAPKTVVDKGVLKTLLYDLKSAVKAGRDSTGNGRRAGYAGDVQVSPFTFYIPAGAGTMADLMRQAGRAIYITELKGMHAGSNSITGDFSLESKGYLVEGGAVVRPAEQFTVAGNFYQMIQDITAIGADFVLDGGLGAPSVLISGLSIAGEG